jgi:hypothetical protein
MKRRWTVALAFLLGFAATGALAERHALLVGVSNYPSLKEMQLHGPGNDVDLLRTLLLQRGFAAGNIRALADGVKDAGEPTRANIMAALEATVAKARAGDYVLLFFAGHGSQQPQDRSRKDQQPEPDGLSEIFLPRDIGRWDGKTGAVQNAIADHELVRYLDALTAKGVFVWAIFDACHSATLMRGGGGPDTRYRQVPPSALGIPKPALDAAEAAAPRSRGGAGERESTLGAAPAKPAGKGGFVAFYAAQTTEITPEDRLPAGHPERKSHGVFSFTLVQALASTQGGTYRQLGQQVLQRYAAENRTAPTPLFTGTHLDAPVFGAEVGAAPMQWQIERSGTQASIPAGALHQLAPGAVLAVVPRPLSKDEEAVAYLRVASTGILSARLEPVEFGGKAAAAVDRLPERAVARLVKPAVSLELRVGLPAPGKADAGGDRARAAIEALRKSGVEHVRVLWANPGQPADLQLVIERGKLWLGGPGGEVVHAGDAVTHSIALSQPEPALRAKLAESIARIARVRNVIRLGNLYGATTVKRCLDVRLGLTRGGKPVALAADGMPRLRKGDLVKAVLANQKDCGFVDVTVLYVSGEFAIDALFPKGGESNRIEPSGSTTVEIEIDDSTVGVERLIVLAVHAQPREDRSDFTFLAQAGLERTRGAPGSLMDLFNEAGFGVASRGSARAPQRTEMRLFSWQVVKSGTAPARK